MLKLSRREGETIVIADVITITVTKVSKNRVSLLFDAPNSVKIMRGEVRQNQSQPRKEETNDG